MLETRLNRAVEARVSRLQEPVELVLREIPANRREEHLETAETPEAPAVGAVQQLRNQVMLHWDSRLLIRRANISGILMYMEGIA